MSRNPSRRDEPDRERERVRRAPPERREEECRFGGEVAHLDPPLQDAREREVPDQYHPHHGHAHSELLWHFHRDRSLVESAILRLGPRGPPAIAGQKQKKRKSVDSALSNLGEHEDDRQAERARGGSGEPGHSRPGSEEGGVDEGEVQRRELRPARRR